MSDWHFGGPTAPFFDSEGHEPAGFVFEQISDDSFALVEGIRYDDGNAVVEVPGRTTITDLASIPLFMAWFVPVNGRHTPAAVVHDKLVRDSRTDSPDRAVRRAASDRRSEADDLFLEAMAATGVPILRRRIMHAAVVMATRWQRGGIARIAMALWVLASLSGTVALVWSALSGAWVVTALSALAPLAGALLWGVRLYPAGVVAGYVALLIALPALATTAGYAVYWLAEQAVRVLAPGTKTAETPPPAGYR